MGLGGSISKKFKVHVSFAEVDLPFVERLLAVLDGLREFDLSITPDQDTDNSEAAKRAKDLIAAADTVVFVVSPAAADAPAVALEAKLAQDLSKRLLTVLSEPVGKFALPAPLSDVKPIAMNTAHLFKANVKQLVQLLRKDREWIQQHTALYARARKWQAAGCSPRLLLAGQEIFDAKMWTLERPEKAPKPTDLHIDYIRSSEDPEVLRQVELQYAEDDDAGHADEDLQAEEAGLTTGKARPIVSRFAKFLRPRRQAPPDEAEPQAVETAPDTVADAEPPPVPVTATVASPETPQPEPAEKPEPLPEPEELLKDVPAAVPAVMARTRPAACNMERNPGLGQLHDTRSDLIISHLPNGHLRPYRKLTKPRPKASRCSVADNRPELAPAAPGTSSPANQASKPCATGRTPAEPTPGSCPWAPRADTQQKAPQPGMRPRVAPLPAQSQPPPAPQPLLARAEPAPAQQPVASPVPGSSPRAPKPLVTNTRPVLLAPKADEDPVPPEHSPGRQPQHRPPVSTSCATPARSRPTLRPPATANTVSIAAAGSPTPRPPADRGAKPARVRPRNAGDDHLDGLLTSFLTQDEDVLKFR